MIKNVPAISIVIPLYNMEKYVGECLESILAQTFQDFEVIVVDDCSTDNSCAIVEGYKSKFNGKLRLIESEKNSGGAGIPRNKGIGLSRGDWLFLMDADDIITETAMAELYETAEKLNVDMLHCERMFSAAENTDEIPADKSKLQIVTGEFGLKEFATQPIFMPDDLSGRIDDYTKDRFWNAPWAQFYRKDFVLKNDLKFPQIGIADDVVFNFYAVCFADHIARIPNVYYVWRKNPNSNIRAVLPLEKTIQRLAGSIFKAISILDKFIDGLPDVEKHAEYKQAVFDLITRVHVGPVMGLYFKNPAYTLDKFIRREIDKVDDKTALTAFLFAQMCHFKASLSVNVSQTQNVMIKQDETIQKLQETIQRYRERFQDLETQIKVLQHKLETSQS